MISERKILGERRMTQGLITSILVDGERFKWSIYGGEVIQAK